MKSWQLPRKACNGAAESKPTHASCNLLHVLSIQAAVDGIQVMIMVEQSPIGLQHSFESLTELTEL